MDLSGLRNRKQGRYETFQLLLFWWHLADTHLSLMCLKYFSSLKIWISLGSSMFQNRWTRLFSSSEVFSGNVNLFWILSVCNRGFPNTGPSQWGPLIDQSSLFYASEEVNFLTEGSFKFKSTCMLIYIFSTFTVEEPSFSRESLSTFRVSSCGLLSYLRFTATSLFK